ncbi:MAG: NAD(P)-binding domain-containing protein, partial [Caldilinea sp.]
MTARFRWGILGPGNIAAKFAAGVAALDDQEVTAVGSRTQASADRFADRFDILRRHVG